MPRKSELPLPKDCCGPPEGVRAGRKGVRGAEPAPKANDAESSAAAAAAAAAGTAMNSCGLGLLSSMVPPLLLAVVVESEDLALGGVVAVVLSSGDGGCCGLLLQRACCTSLDLKVALSSRTCESFCASFRSTLSSDATAKPLQRLWSCMIKSFNERYSCIASFNASFGCKTKDCKGAFVAGEVRCPISSQASMHLRS